MSKVWELQPRHTFCYSVIVSYFHYQFASRFHSWLYLTRVYDFNSHFATTSTDLMTMKHILFDSARDWISSSPPLDNPSTTGPTTISTTCATSSCASHILRYNSHLSFPPIRSPYRICKDSISIGRGNFRALIPIWTRWYNLSFCWEFVDVEDDVVWDE